MFGGAIIFRINSIQEVDVMTVRSSPKKHSIGILKIALWAGIMFLLIKTLSFAGDKFYAFMSALDARVLLVLIGILMVLI